MAQIHPTLQSYINEEKNRLNNDIELIASENYPSQAILDILGSCLSVKYSEGYPTSVSKTGRHYGGCEVIDKVEEFAIEQGKKLFNVNFMNVQPMSGTHANTCVYHAFCKPGAKTLSMSLNSGAHLTHGSKFTYSGRFYENHSYDLIDELIDYDVIKARLFEVKPRLLITGYSAYSHKIDFKRIREFVDEYNKEIHAEIIARCGEKEDPTKEYEEKKCILWCDMAHFAGFIAAHIWEDEYDPTKYCDVITSTTHKTLRGPRGGIIAWNNPLYSAKINQAVFPGNAGGPNEALVAAKAQCFVEAQSEEYVAYMKQVAENMQGVLKGIAEVDTAGKIRIVSGGSSNHLALLDLKNTGLTGKEAEDLLLSKHVVTNKNMIEGDLSPSKSSGLRIGTAAATTRGLTSDQAVVLGRYIAKVLLNEEFENAATDIPKDFEQFYK